MENVRLTKEEGKKLREVTNNIADEYIQEALEPKMTEFEKIFKEKHGEQANDKWEMLKSIFSEFLSEDVKDEVQELVYNDTLDSLEKEDGIKIIVD